MAEGRHTPEQMINKLRVAEVAIVEGSTVAEAAWSIRSADLIEGLAELMMFRGVPDQHSLGQRAGVCGPGSAGVAWAGGSQDALHRPWVAVGDQLHREFQGEFEGRTAGQRGLL